MVLEITVGLILSLLALPILGYVVALPGRRRAQGADVGVSAPVEVALPEAEAAALPEPVAVPEPVVVPEPEPVVVPEPDPEPVSVPEPVATPEPEPEREAPPATPAPVGLRTRLAGTGQALVGRLSGLLGTRTVDEGLLEELEAILFTADLGVKTAESLLDAVRTKASGAPAENVRAILREAILEKLQRVEPGPESRQTTASPHVILVLGVNGSGKTTTIGKLASRYESEGKRVMLGAGDTFRAAAADQLEVWAERAGCEIVKGKPGGDPASVAFDTVKAAMARHADIALIDTAGRLQTRGDLMAELAKISKVIGQHKKSGSTDTARRISGRSGTPAARFCTAAPPPPGAAGIPAFRR